MTIITSFMNYWLYINRLFSCDSSSICGNVGLMVCRSVGLCQQVSRSMKCLKDTLNHNVTVFYVLCITFSEYYTLCIVATIICIHYAYDAKIISGRKAFNGMHLVHIVHYAY